MSCPQYHFPQFCVYQKRLSGKVIPCTGISLATYPNHTDCDYQLEFRISDVVPSQVFISSTSWRGRLVLRSGKTPYRIDGDRVFVLIGKVRFDWLRVRMEEFGVVVS